MPLRTPLLEPMVKLPESDFELSAAVSVIELSLFVPVNEKRRSDPTCEKVTLSVLDASEAYIGMAAGSNPSAT